MKAELEIIQNVNDSDVYDILQDYGNGVIGVCGQIHSDAFPLNMFKAISCKPKDVKMKLTIELE